MITRKMLTKRLPKVDNVSIEFVWAPTRVLFEVLPSADSGTYPNTKEGDPVSKFAAHKRADDGYGELVESIREQGFFDPVHVGDLTSYGVNMEHGLGNGNHRVVAAHDLGYTHIPVTFDDRHMWGDNGPVRAW